MVTNELIKNEMVKNEASKKSNDFQKCFPTKEKEKHQDQASSANNKMAKCTGTLQITSKSSIQEKQ